jgi:hypothetical protein
MALDKVFVSPGVYTSEKDISFVTRNIGVTTLGLVGETTLGPAFQPIFVNDYSQFKSFFGGLDSTLVKDTGAPQYELPYIAKSYLSQADQLFVTRVLGLSGYDAGLAWGITLKGSGTTNNKLVALIRSRGSVDPSTQLVAFQVTGTTNLGISTSVTGATVNPLADFILTGNSITQGAFSYTVSLDKTKKNYLPRVLGREAQSGKAAIFVEELYDSMFTKLLASGSVTGVTLSLISYASSFQNYKREYQEAVTPWVVSELRGSKVFKLYRFHTISDGNAANEQFKISIVNIKPDEKEFDVYIRAFYDTDSNPSILESFTRCNMDPTSSNFIGRRIGTLDGKFASKSLYVLLELDESNDTSDAFPAGFTGYPIRDYKSNSNASVVTPDISYKSTYLDSENKRKFYLGLSDTAGIDADIFDYKGKSATGDWTGSTSGFHMDATASAVTIDNTSVSFVTGPAEFQTNTGLIGTAYDKLYARKFTFAPYGGFDGWDIYRSSRSNTDDFTLHGSKGVLGLSSGVFSNRVLSTDEPGLTSDYYAFLEGIYTFSNPEAVNINVFATPGIDSFNHSNLIEEAIEVVEQERADSLYIITTPDTDSDGQILSIDDVTDQLSGEFDSNYTATYWPWNQILDTENNVYVYLPPTRDVVRNIALTDNISFPWFSVAGVQRGDVDAIKCRIKLTSPQRDKLYDNRINPIATFASDGIKIWGNKTLQVDDTALNRINVRRLLLQARKLISAVSLRLVFDQDDSTIKGQFEGVVNPILNNIKKERGLTDFRVTTSQTTEEMDRNELSGTIFLKPTRSLEFIKVGFVVTSTGASFDNV